MELENKEPCLKALLKSLAQGARASNALPMSKKGKTKKSGDSSTDEDQSDDDDDDEMAYEMAFPEFRRENLKARRLVSHVAKVALKAANINFKSSPSGDVIASLLQKEAAYSAGGEDEDEEEIWDRCADTCDALLEQVDRHVNFVKSGTSPAPNTNMSSLNKYNSMMSRVKDIEKSQVTFGFQHEIDNNRKTPYQTKLPEGPKPFGLSDFTLTKIPGHGIKLKSRTNQTLEDMVAPEYHYPHPYQDELDQLEFSDWQFKCPFDTWDKLPQGGVGNTLFPSAAETNMTDAEFISNSEGLESFVASLDKQPMREVAIDLEAHSYRSFSGFVCLMQMSLRWPSQNDANIYITRDVIIDTLALRAQIGPKLRPLFANPQIVKVMHGADSDVQWLQRDFGIYVVNLFDTHQAAIELGLPAKGLANILHTFAGVTVDKKHQLSDWRQRPLPKDMLQYAQSDTHYLLDVYDKMRRELAISRGNKSLERVLKESKRVCSTICLQEPFHTKGWQKFVQQALSKQQQSCLEALWDWRDVTARKHDESLGYVCSARGLVRIALKMPLRVEELTRILNPLPELIREYSSTLVELIQKAANNDDQKDVSDSPVQSKSTPIFQDTSTPLDEVDEFDDYSNDEEHENVNYLELDPVNQGFRCTPFHSTRYTLILPGTSARSLAAYGLGENSSQDDAAERMIQEMSENPNPCHFTANGFLFKDEDVEVAKPLPKVKTEEKDEMPKSLMENYQISDKMKKPKGRYSGTRQQNEVKKSSDEFKEKTTESNSRPVPVTAKNSTEQITPFDYSNTTSAMGVSLDNNPFFASATRRPKRAKSPKPKPEKITPRKKPKVVERPNKVTGSRTAIAKL